MITLRFKIPGLVPGLAWAADIVFRADSHGSALDAVDSMAALFIYVLDVN